MTFNHIGIPRQEIFEDGIDLPDLKMTVTDHTRNPYGIQLQKYWDDAPYPELVKTVPHLAFEVDDLEAELAGKKVIIEPNSPSKGLRVAFLEDKPYSKPGSVNKLITTPVTESGACSLKILTKSPETGFLLFRAYSE